MLRRQFLTTVASLGGILSIGLSKLLPASTVISSNKKVGIHKVGLGDYIKHDTSLVYVAYDHWDGSKESGFMLHIIYEYGIEEYLGINPHLCLIDYMDNAPITELLNNRRKNEEGIEEFAMPNMIGNKYLVCPFVYQRTTMYPPESLPVWRKLPCAIDYRSK